MIISIKSLPKKPTGARAKLDKTVKKQVKDDASRKNPRKK
jgi:hypothetical protein